MIIVNTFGRYNDYAVYKYLGTHSSIISFDLNNIKIIKL